jgi:hypothetical protein
MQMTEMIRAFPAAAQVIGPELAKNLDWPGADKIADKMEAQAEGQLPPEVETMIEEGKNKIAELEQENAQLKQGLEADMLKIKSQHELKMLELQQDEQIAYAKIESEERVAAVKAKYQAEVMAARPAPNRKEVQ